MVTQKSSRCGQRGIHARDPVRHLIVGIVEAIVESPVSEIPCTSQGAGVPNGDAWLAECQRLQGLFGDPAMPWIDACFSDHREPTVSVVPEIDLEGERIAGQFERIDTQRRPLQQAIKAHHERRVCEGFENPAPEIFCGQAACLFHLQPGKTDGSFNINAAQQASMMLLPIMHAVNPPNCASAPDNSKPSNLPPALAA